MNVIADPANADQRDAWNGDEGARWTANAEMFDLSVSIHHERLLSTAAIQPHERILDVGCGNGRTSLEAAQRAQSGHVLGLDLSVPMLDVARRRAVDSGITNVTFMPGDAQIYEFEPKTFSLAISRNGCMFFADPVAAFSNIRAALAPSGRMVLQVWQPLDRNDWMQSFRAIAAAGRDLPAPQPRVPGPFAMSEPEYVRETLAAAGFHNVTLTDSSAPLLYGSDLDRAFAFVKGIIGWMLAELDPATADRVLSDLRSSLIGHTKNGMIAYGSAAWIIEARAP